MIPLTVLTLLGLTVGFLTGWGLRSYLIPRSTRNVQNPRWRG